METSLRATVWGENVHEWSNPTVGAHYPQGMHRCIAAALATTPGVEVRCATLQEPEHGLGEAVLEATDVLLWWGHKAHGEVGDAVVERVVRRVWEGMGLVVLHSGHFSKVFKRLLGTPCSLTWRIAAERERVWTCLPGHPIARGLPAWWELPESEMYGEPFAIPTPEEQVFISWFAGGEVFRSGCTWRRGAGKVFYFSPGHETYPIYHDPHVQTVLRNAVEWARPAGERVVDACPQRPWAEAPEAVRPPG